MIFSCRWMPNYFFKKKIYEKTKLTITVAAFIAIVREVGVHRVSSVNKMRDVNATNVTRKSILKELWFPKMPRISCFDIPSTVNDLLMKGEEQLLVMAIMYHGQSWALVPKLFVTSETLQKICT